ncbi:hypothetical protein [Clostridium saccharobutylicum]|uniref:Uncharacterized protein n=1 Tax=Clostridium saccharobutylicum DSM 13864 TaxID=1345695 RepID=U5MRY8_CLOSA|nr:hypothetical protein [Clostridium saccharobutylicum]AGX43293.1 hypothetical protein CLSA_c23190 [Clostridium saccharobutylicum DSM 13864]AQR90594.1 hypothetical protein CLOSC_23150 [Clostridium saccharobutylicum]AQS00498.1 hypothetical protein CSACC_23220 [Clostridium saccharobutylicum]AQS10148.1 hypothetical protein CLOBY_22910 [Clostridium saccharobutylicum]AQS14481.1 hypothetical protein CLOSACC_23220 [Clostridium saccharobutylicum]
MALVVKKNQAKKVLEIIQSINQEKWARIISEFVKELNQNIFIRTGFGSKRILSSLGWSMLPRIC